MRASDDKEAPLSVEDGPVRMTRQLLPTPGTAVWKSVRADLLARIESGEYAPNQQLASETLLAQQYGVNRLTVRRALGELVREGRVRTEHGVGSFVAPQMMRHRIDDGEISLLESMRQRGHHVTQQLLATVEHKAPRKTGGTVPDLVHGAGTGLADPSELWNFPDYAGPVVEYRYVLSLDDTPWCSSYVIVPKVLVPKTWHADESLFAALARSSGLSLRRDERRFSAILAGGLDASLLDVPIGSPLLLLSGINVDQGDRIASYIVHRIRGDRAEYAMRIGAPAVPKQG